MSEVRKKRPLPHGWRWARLREVGTFYSGGTPPTDDPAYWDGDIPFVTGADITSLYVREGRAQLTEAGLYSGRTAVCQPGAVLLVTRTRVGRIGIAAVLMGASQDLSPYVCGEAVLPQYICYYLQSLRAYLMDRCRGATIQGLTKGLIENLPIPVAPLDEQRRIAVRLSDQMAHVERMRETACSQVDAAKAVSAALLRQVFDSSDAARWPKKRIGEIAETCSGTTPLREHKDYYAGTVPWVKTGELRDNVIEDTDEHVSEAALRQLSLRLLPVGTLLVAMYGQGQTRGRTAILGRPAATNQACLAILPNATEFDTNYLQLWFRYSYQRLRLETEGRGGNQPNLNGDVLRSQTVPIPRLDEQRRLVGAISTQIGVTDKLREAAESQFDAINALPAALLEEVFGGFEPPV